MKMSFFFTSNSSFWTGPCNCSCFLHPTFWSWTTYHFFHLLHSNCLTWTSAVEIRRHPTSQRCSDKWCLSKTMNHSIVPKFYHGSSLTRSQFSAIWALNNYQLLYELRVETLQSPLESATLFRPDAPPTLPATNSTLHLNSKTLIELLESSSSSTWTNSPPTRRFTWMTSNSSHRTLSHIPHKGLNRHSWMLHSSLLNWELQCNYKRPSLLYWAHHSFFRMPLKHWAPSHHTAATAHCRAHLCRRNPIFLYFFGRAFLYTFHKV